MEMGIFFFELAMVILPIYITIRALKWTKDTGKSITGRDYDALPRGVYDYEGGLTRKAKLLKKDPVIDPTLEETNRKDTQSKKPRFANNPITNAVKEAGQAVKNSKPARIAKGIAGTAEMAAGVAMIGGSAARKLVPLGVSKIKGSKFYGNITKKAVGLKNKATRAAKGAKFYSTLARAKAEHYAITGVKKLQGTKLYGKAKNLKDAMEFEAKLAIGTGLAVKNDVQDYFTDKAIDLKDAVMEKGKDIKEAYKGAKNAIRENTIEKISENTRRKIKGYPIIGVEKTKHLFNSVSNAINEKKEKELAIARENIAETKEMIEKAKGLAQKFPKMKDKILNNAGVIAHLMKEATDGAAGYNLIEDGKKVLANAFKKPVTSGTEEFVPGKNGFKAPKGTLKSAIAEQRRNAEWIVRRISENIRRMLAENNVNNQANSNNLETQNTETPNLYVAYNANQNVSTNQNDVNVNQNNVVTLKTNVMDSAKIKTIIDTMRTKQLSAKQAVDYTKLMEMFERNKSQMKDQEVRNLPEYFVPTIQEAAKQNINLAPRDLYDVALSSMRIEEGRNNSIDVIAGMRVSRAGELKEANIERMLSENEEMKKKFEQAVRENYKKDIPVSETTREKLQAQAKEQNVKLDDLISKQQQQNLEEAINDAVKKVAKNPQDKTFVTEYLGEEGYYDLQKQMDNLSSEYKKALEKEKRNIQKRLDAEFAKNNQITDAKSYEITAQREEYDRTQAIKASIEAKKVQKQNEPIQYINDNNVNNVEPIRSNPSRRQQNIALEGQTGIEPGRQANRYSRGQNTSRRYGTDRAGRNAQTAENLRTGNLQTGISSGQIA